MEQQKNQIIFVNRFFYPDQSATSQLLSDLAFHLAEERDRAVSIITSRISHADPKTELRGRETIRGVTIFRVWSTRLAHVGLLGRLLDYLTFYLASTWRLWKLAGRGDIVVAKTDPPMISIPAAAVCKLRGAGLVNWVQDLFPEVARALGIRGVGVNLTAFLKMLRNRSMKFADRNVVLGNAMANKLCAEGVDESRISIIHNWSDGDTIFPIAPAANALRQEWFPNGQVVVGYSGNMGRAHDFSTILDAAEKLRDRTEVAFLLIGAGVYLQSLQTEVDTRELVNIHFRPFQAREMLCQSLAVPDVHLISLRPEMEGLIVPSKMYGILAAGRPAIFIGAQDGEIARLLTQNACGIAVGQSDSDGLANAIVQLVDDKTTTAAMGEKARQTFDQHYARPLALTSWADLLG